ncbi:hypothetical protein OEA41_007589 [Lepraria neglecta]|uniref:Fungal N-terminal domain-containing protein n=1 Tax=Lepraria neglecta TaxID=209136 RepID=A0AAD9ZCY7_9LECA|nr:hypothetical protein OEA41_007589 [Lepraria neglecta]
MDPLSVSVSIIGMTTAAVQVSRLLKTFIDGANGASTSARGVLMEVTGIYVCLHQLEDFLLGKREAARSRKSLIMIEHLIIIFTDCVSLFSELEQTLESLKTDGHMRVIDRLKWSMKESAISKLLLRLQSSKASLNFMSNVNMSRRLKALERMHPALAASMTSRGKSPSNERNDSRTSNRRATCFGFTFEQELETSPVYKRAALNDLRQSQSSTSTNGPSSLSGLSLCDVSDVSAIALPISSMELWNHHRYTPSGKRLEANVSSFDAWYNPPAKKSAFIRTAYFNGQYTNQYAQSRFTGHLIYRRFTVAPNSSPIFKEGAVMPQTPKELKRVSEELDEDDERAELEDTGIREKNTSGSATSYRLDVALTPLSPNVASFLRVPIELRLQIYREVSVDEIKVFLSHVQFRMMLAPILLANKQIYDEAISIIYKTTTFTLVLDQDCPFYKYDYIRRQHQALLSSKIASKIHHVSALRLCIPLELYLKNEHT